MFNLNENVVAIIIVSLLILFIFFLLLREFACWYLKINQRVAILNDIRNILQSQGKALSQSVSEPIVSEKRKDTAKKPPQSQGKPTSTIEDLYKV